MKGYTQEMAKSRIAKTPAGDKLRDRALYCRRLAAGVGDPEFTLKLTALADEYEDQATLRDAESSPTK